MNSIGAFEVIAMIVVFLMIVAEIMLVYLTHKAHKEGGEPGRVAMKHTAFRFFGVPFIIVLFVIVSCIS